MFSIKDTLLHFSPIYTQINFMADQYPGNPCTPVNGTTFGRSGICHKNGLFYDQCCMNSSGEGCCCGECSSCSGTTCIYQCECWQYCSPGTGCVNIPGCGQALLESCCPGDCCEPPLKCIGGQCG